MIIVHHDHQYHVVMHVVEMLLVMDPNQVNHPLVDLLLMLSRMHHDDDDVDAYLMVTVLMVVVMMMVTHTQTLVIRSTQHALWRV